jgi:hypothetical protein
MINNDKNNLQIVMVAEVHCEKAMARLISAIYHNDQEQVRKSIATIARNVKIAQKASGMVINTPYTEKAISIANRTCQILERARSKAKTL